jgi:hypothetical protein
VNRSLLLFSIKPFARPLNLALMLGALFMASSAHAQTFINFDFDAAGNAITAPTLFSAANPLREEYASLGIHFQGSTASSINGGAILRSTPAFSGTNVLAFNDNATLQNNGRASAPENILFDQSLSSFSIYAAGPNVETVFFARALDVNGIEIADVETTSIGGAYSQLTVNALGIRRIELTAQFLSTPRAPFFALDNLSFTVAPVPAPGALPIAALGFGFIGFVCRRKHRRGESQ